MQEEKIGGKSKNVACFLQLHEIDLHLFTTTEFHANQIFKESKHTPEFDLLDLKE